MSTRDDGREAGGEPVPGAHSEGGFQQEMHDEVTAKSGFVGWFAGHHVAANLLMLFLLAAGALSMASITVEIFPEFSADIITVRVPYLGAAPAETEEGVTVKVEEAIAAIDGIDRLRSTANEGFGVVTIELDEDADARQVLDEVKAAVDRIDTFPAETEEPVISEVIARRQVISVVVFGEADQITLAALAERIRDGLTALDDITQAEVRGVPPYEISIEVSEDALRRYGLSFAQVADAVRRSSLDLPGGAIQTEGGEILLRTKGQRYVGREFEEVVVLTRGDGTRVLLSDVASVLDGFADTDVATRFDGAPAALVQVYRTGDEGALEVTAAAREYLDSLSATLPSGIQLATWQDASVTLRQRIDLLLKNARLGLLLVFVCLALFLDLRLAFWTTLGIPISFLGGLWLLPSVDVTINMISLFAFIVSLGIVVDDAIIVGENVYAKLESGLSPVRAAVEGAREMAAPVTFAVLTSVTAFLPLVFVEGQTGKIMRNIPLVVIAVLAISLVESLLILPAHLSGDGRAPRWLRPILWPLGPVLRGIERVRRITTGGLERFIDGPYRRFLDAALEWRYVTAAAAAAILVVSVGIVAGGLVSFTFMPRIDADLMNAYLKMPQGTPAEQTEAIALRLEKAAFEVTEELTEEYALDQPLLVHVATTVGEQPTSGGGGPTATASDTGTASHLAEVSVELLGGELRGDIASAEAMNRWRQRVGEVVGATSLSYTSTLFSSGDPISVQLAHRDFDSLLGASDRLQELLQEYTGVIDIADSFLPGKRELRLDLTPQGRALGLTLADLARQVRQGFYGEEVQRIQRGRDDLRVMVRYPEAERQSRGDVEAMRIRLADGTEVPFSTVATVEEGRGYAAINRVDRRRVVTVTADLDDSTGANAGEINASLREDLLPRLAADFPGLAYDFEGEQRERNESMGSLGRNLVVALLVMFALLAIPFRSYTQPLIVMSAIPFGFVGALLGHVILGIDLSLLSFFGIVALTGVVVNDSLIMIDLINRERRDGVDMETAIRDSGLRRFRPILLTTLTTFFGLSPMILETSLQAKFLVPMAVSLGFGIVFATAITLILVPVSYRILEDIHGVFRRAGDRAAPPAARPGSEATELGE